ncbi:bifunctional UDP-N-acetylmuramoyl-tripeptide:D-alanyl-D-alanine ligase/alanine racemase [Odoribacter lunatus]|uniref:bifunctional UDP-N-acetylmuramoyl-tripeptide:D-alanyl-D-alanine ligase/alanine racemase n=1 Tax=Odoribacter lunatus TaxID=2941335 RepID=UPI00203FEE43|nr:bifunctional UDP-N-acetylmuramoyl-tripeptide:D-alanyl-D-alanine ligase/alanine racemase [Odoribacter lunatus]
MEISIDSRSVTTPELTMFFALKGPNHDGHDYVVDLYGRGVRHFVISEEREEFADLKDANLYVVEDVLKALQTYAKTHREKMKAEVIAIVGSNGKTIVKEWLYQLLADDFEVYRSPRSYNSQVGVPLSLNGIEEKTQIALIEAGISRKGEMVKLESMIKPDVAVFTHLGDAHGENFASLQEKLAEKAVLFRYCRVIVGREGEAMNYILLVAQKEVEKIVWGESDAAVVRVSDVMKTDKSRTVSVSYKGHGFYLDIPFIDEASYENCMNAVCVLLYKGMAAEKIVAKVAGLQPIAMRMEIKEGVNRCVVVHDYYNSDPSSFQLALNVLTMQDEAKKRVVILSDFVDTGAEKAVLYREVAATLQKAGVALFIGIGEELLRYKDYFMPDSRFYADTDSFLKLEKRENFHDQAILIKGARKYRFEYLAGFLQKQSHNTVLAVDMDAMVHNLTYFRSLIPSQTKLAVMVKAFSYGSGSGEVASLLQYQGVDYLMVAFADEGVALRAEGITVPIAVMNPQPEAFDNMIEFGLEPEIYSLDLLESFDRALVKYGVENYPVHLKLNTGMNRSGLDAEEIDGLLGFFKERRRVRVCSVFSHLAGSDEEVHDEFTRHQIALFVEMADKIQQAFDYKIMRHILNSAGIERFSRYSFDMVRLGIGLHGISAAGAALTPVSSFKTYIASIRKVKAGETIGYGRKGKTERESLIAVVPVGYADGLNRHLSNGVGEMFVRGKRVPIIGNICMDTCMLDITDVPAQVGDEVEIFGKNILVTEVAEKLSTIPYEVLTSVDKRVKRIYFKD